MHKYKIPSMVLGVLDIKTHVKFTPFPTRLHKLTSWKGHLNFLEMDLPIAVLRGTKFLWILSRFMKASVKISMVTSIKKLIQQHLAVNV